MHTCTIFTSCIASRIDLEGAKFGTSIAGASEETELDFPPATLLAPTESSAERGTFFFRYRGLDESQGINSITKRTDEHSRNHSDKMSNTLQD